MLFRRFMIVTASIALTGIFAIQIIHSTQARNNEFSVEQRLQQWQRLKVKNACKHQNKVCFNYENNQNIG